MRGEITVIYNVPDLNACNSELEKKAAFRIFSDMSAVRQALQKIGFNTSCLPLKPPLQEAIRRLESIRADLIFNLFEGFESQPETEAIIADFLPRLGIPYTGCPGTALFLAMDKAEVKARLQSVGINTPRYQVLQPMTLHLFALDFPCIVKPRSEHGSLGITKESVVYDFASLEKQVKIVSERFRGEALVEEFVEGREFNITILGTHPPTTLPISEIIYSLPPGMPPILTFAAKWDPQSLYFRHTTVLCPADVDNKLEQNITAIARVSHKVLGNRGYARVDLRLDQNGQLKVLELNPNPDISPDSGAALQARTAGMEYEQFIEKLVQLALEDYNATNSYQDYDDGRQAIHNGDIEQYSRV